MYRLPMSAAPDIGSMASCQMKIEPLPTVATTPWSAAWRASLAPPSMRPPVDSERIRALARALAEVAHEDVTLYLTGGATAVIEGWRPTTIDVDIRLEPDTDALMRRIVTAKSELDINVELASPPDFIPELPGWRERSPFVLREGRITVRHFDLYSQALSKIERGFAKDLDDVAAMIGAALIDPTRLEELFEEIEAALHRYPAIDAGAFRHSVRRALGE